MGSQSPHYFSSTNENQRDNMHESTQTVIISYRISVVTLLEIFDNVSPGASIDTVAKVLS